MDSKGLAITKHLQVQWLIVGILFLGTSFFFSGPVCSAEPVVSIKNRPAVRYRSITSRSGHFLVTGVDSRENLAVADWAEKIRERTEEFLGIKLSEGDRQAVRITLVAPSENTTFRVRAGHESWKGKWIHSLTVEGNDKVDYEDLQGALCYLLLSRHVFLSAGVRPGKEDGPVDIRKEAQLARYRLPYWFVEGVSQNLAADLRTKDNEVVYEEWRGGQIKPIGHFLEGPAREMGTHEAAAGLGDVPSEEYLRAMSGMLMNWLMSLPEKNVRAESMMKRALAGEPMTPEWVTTLVPGADTLSEMDELWDRWIIHQQSVVVRPGQVTSRAIDRLRSELLLYTGDFGIPLSGRVNQLVGWSELIVRRKEGWIPLFAQSKGAALQLAAVGRGDRVERVVNGYRSFLDALGRGRSERKLGKLLAAARRELKAFVASVVQVGQEGTFEMMGPPRPGLILTPSFGSVGPPQRGHGGGSPDSHTDRKQDREQSHE